MVPSYIIDLAELPRTHSGKLSETAAKRSVNENVSDKINALTKPEAFAEIRKNHNVIQVRKSALTSLVEKGIATQQPLRARHETSYRLSRPALTS